METELLKCPFCGGEPEKIMIGNDHTKKRSVEIKCTKCFTLQKTGAIRASHEQCEIWAIEKWNNRHSELSAKIEAIKAEFTDEWIELNFNLNSDPYKLGLKKMRDEMLNKLK